MALSFNRLGINALALLLTLLSWSSDVVGATDKEEAFLRCFTHHVVPNTSQPTILTPEDPSFNATLLSSIHNSRFLRSASRPALIVSPSHESHLRASVVCGRRHGLRLRTRSGGHDFAGLSYRSTFPEERFVMVDLPRLRSIDIDVKGRTAWVEAGATIGELYYEIAKHSNVLGFPAGIVSTVGVGGHISGGGTGFMIRKHGLAADNVVNARIVDVFGRLLDRDSMGEDMFWAIRGGGGASFGIILSYKIQLVDVPPVVTVFSIARSGTDQRTAKLISKWQHVAPKAVKELHLSVAIFPSQSSSDLLVEFQCLFLGNRSSLLPIMEESFPELGLKSEDCKEMRWIDSVLFFSLLSNEPMEELLDRSRFRLSFKSKFDFVKEPMSEADVEGMLRWLVLHGSTGSGEVSGWRLDLDALGGRMDEISEWATPYPHRSGNLYKIIPVVSWLTEQDEGWLRSFYDYMTPYVSKEPRCAYYNVKDLDLGRNPEVGKGTYEEAKVWGMKYFKGNFRRLAAVKHMVDPENYFWSEQSIPPLDAPLDHV